ncbi:MAG TPA: hypothetical protein VKV20_19965 [Ktedonobacteraceae bacterium]|jgi:hypothetical protein|nr:hypothetical protein [Ktedonobacteraceae bacterium]
MSFNSYLYEKSIAERHSQILHDFEQSHVRASARQQPTFVRSVVGKFGTLLVELGSQLEEVGEQGEAVVQPS